MARINYPVSFADEQTLFNAILAQNTRLGTKSPLISFTKLQKIDIAKLAATVDPAAEQNTASINLRKDSEKDTQHGDAALALPWAYQLSEVQFLKHFYAGMERDLGDWVITVDAQSRIVYPTGVAAAELIQTFLNHHL